MKRDIACTACRKDWEPLVGKYPGETVKLVDGPLLHSCLCDSCGRVLDKGAPATAVSVSTPSQPYIRWEYHYLGGLRGNY